MKGAMGWRPPCTSNAISSQLQVVCLLLQHPLAGMTVVFTGTRHNLLKTWVRSLGGRVTQAVSSKTTLVAADCDSIQNSSRKVKMAQEKGIRVQDVYVFFREVEKLHKAAKSDFGTVE